MPAHRVRVHGVPAWVNASRLLGAHGWRVDGDALTAELDRPVAATLAARMRGLVLGGAAVTVEVTPRLGRPAVRRARTEDARARRHTTPGFVRRGTRTDAEGRISLTPEAIAVDLAERVGDGVVVDACCGVGGNAIAFARRGCRVIAVERDRERLAMARHNAGVYGVLEGITFRHGDAFEVVPTLEADALFVDPPWAGLSRHPCGRSDLPLLGLLELEQFGRRFAKVPPSFDVDTLPGFTSEAVFGRAEGDRHRVKLVWLALGRTR